MKKGLTAGGGMIIGMLVGLVFGQMAIGMAIGLVFGAIAAARRAEKPDAP